jgi:hypothetical protein
MGALSTKSARTFSEGGNSTGKRGGADDKNKGPSNPIEEKLLDITNIRNALDEKRLKFLKDEADRRKEAKKARLEQKKADDAQSEFS